MPAKPTRLPSSTPTLRVERQLLREGAVLVAGMDEVGRGALAGPVSVGVAVVSATTRTAPAGVRDSKLLSPATRETLVPRLRRWAHASAVGHASSEEIDAFGIIAALRLAGRRALASLPVTVDVVILDGSHNWLALPEAALFDLAVEGAAQPEYPELAEPRVMTLVKADRRCAAVASASVLAKVERDGMLTELANLYPEYGWAENKGYSAPSHLSALRELGPCALHRRSWNVKAWTGEVDLSDAASAPEVSTEVSSEVSTDVSTEIIGTASAALGVSAADSPEVIGAR